MADKPPSELARAPDPTDAPVFDTPSSAAVKRLPANAREKAENFAEQLTASFKSNPNLDYFGFGGGNDDGVCGYVDDDEPPSPRMSMATTATGVADESKPGWPVDPASPLTLHGLDPSNRRGRGASFNTTRSTGSSIGTSVTLGQTPSSQRYSRERSVPRRPTLDNVFSSTQVPISHLDTPKPRSRRPTIKDSTTEPDLPTESSQAQARPTQRSLQEMVAAPSLPSQSIIRQPAPRRRTPAQHLEELVTTSDFPVPRPELTSLTDESPGQRRPTLADILFPSPSGAPPSDPLPPHPRAMDRRPSSGAVPRTPSAAGSTAGNAFANPDFWSTIGRQPPRLKDRSNSNVSAYRSSGEVIRTTEVELVPEVEEEEDQNSGDDKQGGRVEQAAGAFVKSMGRVLGRRPSDGQHPFSGPDPPNEPASRLAYNLVKETLIAYWYSESRYNTPETSRNVGVNASKKSLAMSPRQSSGPPSPAREAFIQGLGGVMPSSPQPPLIKLSDLPGSVKSKQKRGVEWEPPVFDNTTRRVFDATKLVADQMIREFSTMSYPSLKKYIKDRPEHMEYRLLTSVQAENRFIEDTSVLSEEQLATGDWKKSKDSISSPVLYFSQNPSTPTSPIAMDVQPDYETILHRQRRGLKSIHHRQRDHEVRVLDPGLRILWAGKFMEWAKENHDQYLAMYKDQKETSKALKALHMETGLDKDESEHEEKDSDDDEISYGTTLKSIQDLLIEDRGAVSDGESSSRPQRDSAEVEVRRRRRRTQYNVGLRSPAIPDFRVTSRESVNAEDVDEWAQELDFNLQKEKQRQMKEQAQKGKHVKRRDSVRRDPAFEFGQGNSGLEKKDLRPSIDSETTLRESIRLTEDREAGTQKTRENVEENTQPGDEGDEFEWEDYDDKDTAAEDLEHQAEGSFHAM